MIPIQLEISDMTAYVSSNYTWKKFSIQFRS